MAVLTLLLLFLLPFLGYGIVYFDCSNAFYCPNETTVKLTCKTTNCFLEWIIGNPPQEIDFNCVDSVGTTEFRGANTANLTAIYHEGYALISDLNFKAMSSFSKQIVTCLDGFDGHSLSCSLIPMSFNGILTNITLIVKQSCATIKWNPPYHGNVDQYALNITPFPKFGICNTGRCTVYTENATITGLEQDINYTLSIVASACHTTSHALTTYVFIERDAYSSLNISTSTLQFLNENSTQESVLLKPTMIMSRKVITKFHITGSSSYVYISQFSTGIEESGTPVNEEHYKIMWSFIAGSATLFACVILICHVIIGCVLYCRYHQKKFNLHSAENFQELFEMTHNPIYDHCIQTFNNSAYGQVGQAKV